MQCFNHKSPPALRLLASPLVLLLYFLLLIANPSLAQGDDTKTGDKKSATKSELIWKSGDRLPGVPVGFKDNKLLFKSAIFREPLELGVEWLRAFETNTKSTETIKSDERFAIQLLDGQVFLADIISLDEDVLTIQSDRAGKFEIDRTRLASIINREISQTLVSGKLDLDVWEAKRGEKQYWKPNDSGEVQATRDDIHLFLKSDLPKSCLIDIEVGWEDKLDFVLALEIPRGARSLGSVPRLESWDGSIVFSHDDDFEIVIADVDEVSRSLKLLVHWNRETNVVTIHDELGAELATAKIEKFGYKADPGILLQNKNGDFRVKSLGIRSAVVGFDPSVTSIQLKSDDSINAGVESFDGTAWTATKDGDAIEIAADEFIGAFQINSEAEYKQGVGDKLRFHDGEKVIGAIVAVSQESVTIETSAASQPVEFKSAGLKQIQFSPDSKAAGGEKFNHVLVSDVGKIGGRLESGAPTDDNVMFWRVQGATQAVPFSTAVLGDDNINAKVLLKQDRTVADNSNQWPDTLFLNNRDLLPVSFLSANEHEIVVDSFFENRVIPGSEIRAVEFGAQQWTADLDFSDPGWIKKGRAKLKENKIQLKKTGVIGHPGLLGCGGFEFDAQWSNDKYGIVKVECGKALNKDGEVRGADAQSFLIMLYGQQYYVVDEAEGQNFGQNVRQKKKKAVRFKVSVVKNRLVVHADGKKCFSKKLTEGFGRSVSFAMEDKWGMEVSCTLSRLELADGFLSGEFIDNERKELVLTIPRLKARNPPGHILCASNYDLARGNIVSINDEHVMFRADDSVNRYPRSILNTIVWIDSEALIKSLADEQSGDDADDADDAENAAEKKPPVEPEKKELTASDSRQIAQVLMLGGRRVTLTLTRWEEEQLVGQSSLLGKCTIPFEQIYEIRMGKFAAGATDVPWSDWVAKLAPKPKLDGGGAPGQEDSTIFGTDSPLIGQSPKVTFPMLDGKKLTLESLKGKVVVLDFWASWCGPCVKSMPGIKKVIDSYPESAVVLITVNQNESRKKIEAFLERRELELKVARDDGEISEKFDVEAIPQTVLIDSAGEIKFVKVGIANNMEKKLKAAIDSLLDAPSAE